MALQKSSTGYCTRDTGVFRTPCVGPTLLLLLLLLLLLVLLLPLLLLLLLVLVVLRSACRNLLIPSRQSPLSTLLVVLVLVLVD